MNNIYGKQYDLDETIKRVAKKKQRSKVDGSGRAGFKGNANNMNKKWWAKNQTLINKK